MQSLTRSLPKNVGERKREIGRRKGFFRLTFNYEQFPVSEAEGSGEEGSTQRERAGSNLRC